MVPLSSAFVAMLFVGTAAAAVEDFSNNLATDVAPLIAFFGENPTKQYLSESTSYIDYFIFAMAPIGIITAMVSTIRTCGSSALRAFIGRAQEGRSAVEAELCTSMSRDVCELFNRGSITRTLGTSGIIEVIFFPRRLYQETLCEPGSHEDGGAERSPISLLPFYLQNQHSKWKHQDPQPRIIKLKRFFTGQTSPSDPEEPNSINKRDERYDSINPNLSINVGIKKSHSYVFFAVALLGFVLQAGVIAMAGVLSLGLQWTNNGKPTTIVPIRTLISGNSTPVLFIAGTVLLCGGMFWCASLIGGTYKGKCV